MKPWEATHSNHRLKKYLKELGSKPQIFTDRYLNFQEVGECV